MGHAWKVSKPCIYNWQSVAFSQSQRTEVWKRKRKAQVRFIRCDCRIRKKEVSLKAIALFVNRVLATFFAYFKCINCIKL